MTVRFLWTLERPDQPVKSGLDTVKDLTAILVAEDLPGVMPADWVMATLAMEEDPDATSKHASLLGWTLSAKRVQT